MDGPYSMKRLPLPSLSIGLLLHKVRINKTPYIICQSNQYLIGVLSDEDPCLRRKMMALLKPIVYASIRVRVFCKSLLYRHSRILL